MEGENSELKEQQSNHSDKTLKLCNMASTKAKMGMTCSKKDEMSVR